MLKVFSPLSPDLMPVEIYRDKFTDTIALIYWGPQLNSACYIDQFSPLRGVLTILPEEEMEAQGAEVIKFRCSSSSKPVVKASCVSCTLGGVRDPGTDTSKTWSLPLKH